MQEGLLWFDPNPRRSLVEKVARAADRYHIRFGRRPNLCYVNPLTLGGDSAGASTSNGAKPLAEATSINCNGIWLVPSPNVLKNHFWIGVEETSELRRAA